MVIFKQYSKKFYSRCATNVNLLTYQLEGDAKAKSVSYTQFLRSASCV